MGHLNPRYDKSQRTKVLVKEFAEGRTFPTNQKAYETFTEEGNKLSSTRFFNILKELGIQDSVIVKQNTSNNSYVSSSYADMQEPAPEKLTYVRADEIHYPDTIYKGLKTNSELDAIISSGNGGFMPAGITLVPGESGIGKTTLLLWAAAKAKEHNKNLRVLFLSSEMNDIHIFKYHKRLSMTGIDILFLKDYMFQSPHVVVERCFDDGWDLIIVDSFQDVVDTIKDAVKGWNASRAEVWFLALMDKTRKKQNKKELYTHIICTMHMTKGNVFVGSTKIKHMVDSMMEMRRDVRDRDYTYITYSKNRDGGVWRRLYFSIPANPVDNKHAIEFHGEPTLEEDDEF